MLARRHLLRGGGLSVLLPCLLTAGLILAGFALAHVGMNLSWTGRAAMSNLDWLHYSALCTGAFFAAQALLHLLSGRRADSFLLPIAAFLASLGAINLYVWETRDANAYVSTVALPALREFEQSTLGNAKLTPNQKARILTTLGPIPNELDYERQGLGTATVLDRGWLATYNASARRFASLKSVREGSAPSRSVHPIELHTRLDKQVFALVAGFLLVPFTLLAGIRRVRRMGSRITGVLFGAAAVLVGTAGVAAFASHDRGMPLLLDVRGHSLTAFELLKLALVLVLAVALGHASGGRDPARRLRMGIGFAAAGAAIYLVLSRDLGAGIALLALAALIASLVFQEADRIAPVAVAAAVFACAPPLVGALDDRVPETLAARMGMWSEPWASYHRAELQNETSRTLARILALRQSRAEIDSTRAPQRPRPVADDVAKVSAELRFRADALVGRPSSARPLVPEPRSREARLLYEAERLWARLREAGPAPTSAEAKASLRARVHAAVLQLQARASELVSPPPSPPKGAGPTSAGAGSKLARHAGPDDFQIQRGLFALRKGGVLGTGLGRGRPEAVPGLSEDLPLVAVGETLGFAGLLLVALFVLLLTGRTLELACRSGRSLSGFLLMGIGMLFGLQALISIGALAVALPFTGLTFPFLSRSGTALAGSFVAIGLIATLAAASHRVGHGDARAAWLPRFPAGGLATAFALVLVTVGVVQVTGRTLTGGPFLAALPDEDAPFLHAQDPWQLPSYRSVAGSITDRSGHVLAKTTAVAGKRVYPDTRAASLAHTLVQLDEDFRRALAPDTPASPPVGPTLVTTIDSQIQQAVDRAITAGVRKAGVADPDSVRGAAIVLDSRTGAILAVTSRPIFSLAERHDPTAWARAEALDRRDGFAGRYLNRAVAARYPPASTFKTITAAAALDRGLHDLRSKDFDYRGGPQGPRKADGLVHLERWHGVELPYGPSVTDENHPDLHDWSLNLVEAFAWSCNVAFGELGMELGAANLIGFARRFGFEREIHVPGLGTSWSRMDGGWNRRPDSRRLARTLAGQARAAFGQEEVRATPLQMALVAAAIAHDGTIMTPHVVAGLRHTDGEWIQRNRPRILLRTGLSKRTLAGMRTMMRAAVTFGLGRKAKLNPRNQDPALAGKTGSAEWSSDRRALPHSWFIGYFPAESPRIAVAVVIERGGLGQRTAARVARMIVGSPALRRYVNGTYTR